MPDSGSLIPPPTPEDLALDLEAVLARAEAATPGPWEQGYRTSDSPPNDTCWAQNGRHIATGMMLDGDVENFAFIAAARSDVPALVRLAAHYKRQADRVESAGLLHLLDGLCNWRDHDGWNCREAWTTERTGQRLCNRHAAIVELAREPIRPPD